MAGETEQSETKTGQPAVVRLPLCLNATFCVLESKRIPQNAIACVIDAYASAPCFDMTSM